MKKSQALEAVKKGEVEGAQFLLDYFERRNGVNRNDPAIYRFVRKKTGLSVDEWQSLVDQVQ